MQPTIINIKMQKFIYTFQLQFSYELLSSVLVMSVIRRYWRTHAWSYHKSVPWTKLRYIQPLLESWSLHMEHCKCSNRILFQTLQDKMTHWVTVVHSTAMSLKMHVRKTQREHASIILLCSFKNSNRFLNSCILIIIPLHVLQCWVQYHLVCHYIDHWSQNSLELFVLEFC